MVIDNKDVSTDKKYFKVYKKLDIRNEIINLLKSSDYGLNISQIAEKLGISRYTARNYLGILEKEKRIDVKEIGRSKLIYIKQIMRKTKSSGYRKFYSNFLKSLFESLDKFVPNIIPKPEVSIKKIGKEMSKSITWPSGKILQPTKLSNDRKEALKYLSKFTLQFFDLLNEINEYFTVEVVPNPLDKGEKSILIKAQNIGFEYANTEFFHYLFSGIFESRLQENFGEDIYLKVKQFQNGNSIVYYELGLNH
ncbi:MAG: ArsR family transcriptional regulator [Promethearchaeota archaeon]|nr:MAG: ArsR family transcriptional regulator [Candidatus Lokiarchaeota archaeon]